MRWLLDEMLPPALADELTTLGHDAVAAVRDGLAGAVDDDVYQRAVDERRVLVTENFADFAALTERHAAADHALATVVFVRKRAFPAAGLAHHLAAHLHTWAEATPEPSVGIHWP